jgi:hypothetical protein
VPSASLRGVSPTRATGRRSTFTAARTKQCTWVWQPQAFRVESESARALIVFTPGGLEGMFEEGGVPATGSAEPPAQEEYDLEAAGALATSYGFEVVGPLLE